MTSLDLKSQLDLQIYLKDNISIDIKITTVFGGWAATDVLWNKIIEVFKTSFDIIPIKFDKNYGKAYVVNALVKSAENIKFHLKKIWLKRLRHLNWK